MALTTRAIVLQRLGLADDLSPQAAMLIVVASGTKSVEINQTTLQLLIPSIGLTVDLSHADYDTLSELAAYVTSASGSAVVLTVVDGVGGTLPSSSLLTQTVSVTAGTPDYLTYSPHATTGASALIDVLIPAADAAIGRYCNRFNTATGAQELESAARDEKYDGEDFDELVLRNYPVSSITSVKTIGDDGTETTVASTSYRSDLGRGRLFLLGSSTEAAWTDEWIPRYGGRTGWARGFQNIRVQYVAGYATVPAGLQAAATSIVVDMYLNRKKNMQVGQQGLIGTTYSNSVLASEITAQYARLLAPYRRIM